MNLLEVATPVAATGLFSAAWLLIAPGRPGAATPRPEAAEAELVPA